ncbi:16S rRNA (cytidine(1402)-2'-O)-methyltransferase [Bifidobacterium sp. UTBIF-78]|uniref:16S rRNA (cytidine(1402)-2'-O)-methyltransferase n=1 Tax=Bifidobacterium sp. UTBIF-78 TaxID=1465263 RepID=UPI00280AB566|nr:16S rRNA (cytidine(1402)-2'-O)-methyltransferase [Bifidobacterium sp. UTBIF-78]TPF93978.1 SAM-dependent methyltransferase [Bifidobacterium sp. UTBIF-78]
MTSATDFPEQLRNDDAAEVKPDESGESGKSGVWGHGRAESDAASSAAVRDSGIIDNPAPADGESTGFEFESAPESVSESEPASESVDASSDVESAAPTSDSRAAAVTIPSGTVVLAATPIGNTGDASARLVALLERADIVAAEDTRRLYDLARRLGVYVNGRVVAYHDHNERGKADGLLDQVETGATVLVVSDAGMPTINDPGLAIVRRAIERGLPVTCAPGPSAVLDALALSGLPTDRFCYEGFLPRKHAERVQYLRTMLGERRTIVFYETPHRIADSMDDLLDAFGPNRPMALCRELTKDYEEIRRGTIGEIRQGVIDNPPRGEMVLVIGGASDEEAEAAAPSSLSVEDMAVLAIDRALEDGLRIKDAIAQVVQEHPQADGSLANRKQVYQAVLDIKG